MPARRARRPRQPDRGRFVDDGGDRRRRRHGSGRRPGESRVYRLDPGRCALGPRGDRVEAAPPHRGGPGPVQIRVERGAQSTLLRACACEPRHARRSRPGERDHCPSFFGPTASPGARRRGGRPPAAVVVVDVAEQPHHGGELADEYRTRDLDTESRGEDLDVASRDSARAQDRGRLVSPGLQEQLQLSV